jgi:hypothetical protein
MNRKEFVNRYSYFGTNVQLLLLIYLLFLGSCRLGTKDSSDQTSTGAVVYVRSANINSYADVVSRVAPSVVTIRSERRVRAPQQHPFFDDRSSGSFSAGALDNRYRSRRNACSWGSDRA